MEAERYAVAGCFVCILDSSMFVGVVIWAAYMVRHISDGTFFCISIY